MPFSAEELAYYENINLDFHIRGPAVSQVIQDRPLFNDLWANKKTFPGGKDYITGPVKGVYTAEQVGYEGEDEQVFDKPLNIKRWRVKWYETAANLKLNYTELKKNGVSIVEGSGAPRAVTHTDAELVQLSSQLDDANEDLIEGSRRSLADMFWQDGTQDAKAVPGIQSFILGAPTTGTTFNIDRAANSWWRNRSSLGLSITTPANLAITNKLQSEFRQLRRFATSKLRMYCGSTWLSNWEAELRSKGDFTLSGWAGKASMDMSLTDIAFKGVIAQYDPHLDDLGLEKYCYILDLNAIKLYVMEGEEWKTYTPHRPPEVFALYKQLTFTGALTANRLNSSGVYSTV